MANPLRLLPVLPAMLLACSDEVATPPAAATFDAFQRALQQRDEVTLRQLVSTESAAAIAELPWERIQSQAPLQVVGTTATNSPSRTLVDIVDPNRGGQRSQFVVVREHGRLVVDLVASAGLHAEIVEASTSTDELVPRELTPADFDRIRQHELQQPTRDR
jgi:hypothetical protein